MLGWWVKKSLWTVLLGVLVVLPARLAHSPENAQATAGPALTSRRETGSGPVGWVVLASSVAVIPAYLLLRRRGGRA